VSGYTNPVLAKIETRNNAELSIQSTCAEIAHVLWLTGYLSSSRKDSFIRKKTNRDVSSEKEHTISDEIATRIYDQINLKLKWDTIF